MVQNTRTKPYQEVTAMFYIPLLVSLVSIRKVNLSSKLLSPESPSSLLRNYTPRWSLILGNNRQYNNGGLLFQTFWHLTSLGKPPLLVALARAYNKSTVSWKNGILKSPVFNS